MVYQTLKDVYGKAADYASHYFVPVVSQKIKLKPPKLVHPAVSIEPRLDREISYVYAVEHQLQVTAVFRLRHPTDGKLQCQSEIGKEDLFKLGDIVKELIRKDYAPSQSGGDDVPRAGEQGSGNNEGREKDRKSVV